MPQDTKRKSKGFLRETKSKGFLRETKDALLVGAEDLSDRKFPYYGPTARIEHDDTWLHIVTDDYEGHAMLNIEALPFLRLALDRIARERRRALAKSESR